MKPKSINIEEKKNLKNLKIALAGNPNVGKSVVFNKLTGLSQVIGNWPGKTVKKAEGKAKFENYIFNLVDLPGIYSFSTFSLEEIVSRDFILDEHPDYIINVIDANKLERNLFFTLQLIMLGRPVIIALNQYDLLQKRGYDIDIKKLEEILGVPVIPTIAVHNRGVHELLEKIIELDKEKERNNGKETYKPKKFEFGKEIESKIQKISELICDPMLQSNISRFSAIKYLENDSEYVEKCRGRNKGCIVPNKSERFEELLQFSEKVRNELENIHGEEINLIINSEIYNIAHKINTQVEKITKQSKVSKISLFVDHITVHSIFGYIILAVVLMGSYFVIFQFGDWFSGITDAIFEAGTPSAQQALGGVDSLWYKVLWNGFFGGLMGGIGGVLPYVIPFFLVIEILQDIGYLPRAAYLMDNFLHKIGVHGKTIIPILLGFGCNVPAITACSIMDNEKEKKKAIVISSMIPCSAVATIVMGMVAKHYGFGYAMLLYITNFIAIILVGKIMTRLEAIEDSELIIELHDFRVPNTGVVLKQTWHRSKEFVYTALPLIVILGGLMEVLLEFELLMWVNVLISPITVWFMGLPIGVGVYLFYGILRKELNLILVELYVVSLALTMTTYFEPIQMMVFCLVTMLYIPCFATIIVVAKETDRKFANQLMLMEIVLAVVTAGIIRWLFVLMKSIFRSTSDLSLITLTFVIFFILITILLMYISRKKKEDILISTTSTSTPVRNFEKLSMEACGGCSNCSVKDEHECN